MEKETRSEGVVEIKSDARGQVSGPRRDQGAAYAAVLSGRQSAER
jgi:hypothetical protein